MIIRHEDITAIMAQLACLLEAQRLHQAGRLARSGRFGQAERIIMNAPFSEQGSQTTALLLLAKIYAQQGKIKKAVECWQNVLGTDPENSEAIRGLACMDTLMSGPPVLPAVRTFVSLTVMVLIAFAFYWRVTDLLETNHRQTVRAGEQFLIVTEKRMTSIDENVGELSAKTTEDSKQINQAAAELKDRIRTLEQLVGKQFEAQQETRAKQMAILSSNLMENWHQTQSDFQARQDQDLQLLKDRIIKLESDLAGYFTKNQEALQSRLDRSQNEIRQDTKKYLEALSIVLERIDKQVDQSGQKIEKFSELNNERAHALLNRINEIQTELQSLKAGTGNLNEALDELKQSLKTLKDDTKLK